MQDKIITKDTKDTKLKNITKTLNPKCITKYTMDINSRKYKGIQNNPIPQRSEEVAKTTLDAAFKVHTALGPGLLESVYETCLAYELKGMGLMFESQIALPIIYNGITVESGLRLDLYVEKCVIIEIKAVEIINPIHKAQLLTYLKLSGVRLGLLINFNVIHLRDGITRLVN
jgi:GxxExxY protein